jgi:hypothetical protein
MQFMCMIVHRLLELDGERRFPKRQVKALDRRSLGAAGRGDLVGLLIRGEPSTPRLGV